MRNFVPAILFSIACLVLAAWYAIESGKPLATVMSLVIILGILEISLSFDNAIVNAAVLDDMDERWQRYFLTWGILIAVFGMRLVFPIVIVAVTASLWPQEVLIMALDNPDAYAEELSSSHVDVSAFGGMFLLLVFLTFLCDRSKTVHWLGFVEEKLAEIGRLESVELVIALIALLLAQLYLPEESKVGVLIYGMCGVILFVLVDSLSILIAPRGVNAIKRNGAIGFIYLEILDASFSFDGVLAAFAITTDIVIIMLGLAIGAMFVRNLTVYLVRKGTLDEYMFLEHGAHYAIGALAVIMLTTMTVPIHEVVTGLVGVTLIGLSLFSSIQYKRKNITRP